MNIRLGRHRSEGELRVQSLLCYAEILHMAIDDRAVTKIVVNHVDELNGVD